MTALLLTFAVRRLFGRFFLYAFFTCRIPDSPVSIAPSLA